jgi:hypothetical protein
MHSAFGSKCPQCGADLIAPEWSQHVCDRCIRHVWSCDACGRRFQDLVCLPAPSLENAMHSSSFGRYTGAAPFSLERDMRPHFAGRKSLL